MVSHRPVGPALQRYGCALCRWPSWRIISAAVDPCHCCILAPMPVDLSLPRLPVHYLHVHVLYSVQKTPVRALRMIVSADAWAICSHHSCVVEQIYCRWEGRGCFEGRFESTQKRSGTTLCPAIMMPPPSRRWTPQAASGSPNSGTVIVSSIIRMVQRSRALQPPQYVWLTFSRCRLRLLGLPH